ncbi:hypothetical protein NA56DRAFT_644375 [Hyaloscypha hepaticicola]|uniref:Uncharacterized protein n=1 Tax=Hyaloscypha hepaticicola TaxID=2082293 RepID=A0A2J6Q923_9HELO|nr:hypothetical protein NA56DRAFT_644375 [Hyaloscypha hepaticicola]
MDFRTNLSQKSRSGDDDLASSNLTVLSAFATQERLTSGHTYGSDQHSHTHADLAKLPGEKPAQ